MTEPRPAAGDLVVRATGAGLEPTRARHLFGARHVPAGATLLVAERLVPRPRFVAVAAVWTGEPWRLRLAVLPGGSHGEVLPELVKAAMVAAREQGAGALRLEDVVPAESTLHVELAQRGFAEVHRVRYFSVPRESAWRRLSALHLRAAGRIPLAWACESLGESSQEQEIFALVQRYRLLGVADFRWLWRDREHGFDRDLSMVLRTGNELIGVLLMRRVPRALLVDVRAVPLENPQLRALANLALMHGGMLRRRSDEPAEEYLFRAGAEEHRETAQFALRMGGRELTPQVALERVI